ncbi:MAG: hypothetical protein HFI30_01925 [Lachnospiraceae bacterium]|jgi:hypothetical protein|nr:hypothetical protein [Lachnospiraceae bacterium]
MEYTRGAAIQRLLKSFEAYYDVHKCEPEEAPLTARCEYFEHSEKYVISKKAELWSADSEEFLYLLDIPHLTKELYEKWRNMIYEDGMSRVNRGPGHMYSFITPVFVCDTCEEDARKALKKCRIYKSFHFSLHGWMDYHVAVVDLSKGRVDANRSGHSTAKILKNILFPKK